MSYGQTVSTDIGVRGYANQLNSGQQPRDLTSMENIASRISGGNDELSIILDNLLHLEAKMCGGVGGAPEKPESTTRPMPSGHVHVILYSLDEISDKFSRVREAINRLQSVI